MGLGQIILLSITVFLGITLLLVAMLLYAKSKLTAGGTVKININDEKELEVAPDLPCFQPFHRKNSFFLRHVAEEEPVDYAVAR